ncbi:MAG: GIY-YIG nuclease family protein [Candidatus Korarchaeum sp.]
MRSSGGYLRVGALGTFEVPEGILAYVGSAYGPGGLIARISRHFRKGKRLRWHVDYLTESGLVEVEEALALPSVRERELLEVVMGFGEPLIPGFGCSDSRGDITHLFKLKDHIRLREFLIDKYSAQELH